MADPNVLRTAALAIFGVAGVLGAFAAAMWSGLLDTGLPALVQYVFASVAVVDVLVGLFLLRKAQQGS